MDPLIHGKLLLFFEDVCYSEFILNLFRTKISSTELVPPPTGYPADPYHLSQWFNSINCQWILQLFGIFSWHSIVQDTFAHIHQSLCSDCVLVYISSRLFQVDPPEAKLVCTMNAMNKKKRNGRHVDSGCSFFY